MRIKVLDITNGYNFKKTLLGGQIRVANFLFCQIMIQSTTAHWHHHFIRGNEKMLLREILIPVDLCSRALVPNGHLGQLVHMR